MQEEYTSYHTHIFNISQMLITHQPTSLTEVLNHNYRNLQMFHLGVLLYTRCLLQPEKRRWREQNWAEDSSKLAEIVAVVATQ